MTLEEGKPLPEATGEVHRAATLLAWDCEEGRRAYGRIIPSPTNEVLSVRQVPVGPVGAFVPWNFPAGGPMRKIAAALAAGCSIVIKPSEETPGTVFLLARAFEEAGLPPGVLNLVFGVPDEISRRVIASPAIRFLAFTGSIPVGKHIAGLAAASMKPAIDGARRSRARDRLRGHRPGGGRQAAVRGQVRRTPARCAPRPAASWSTGGSCPRFTDALVGERRSRSATGSTTACRWARWPTHAGGPACTDWSPTRVERGATRGLIGGATHRRARGSSTRRPCSPTCHRDARVMNDEPFGPIAPVVGFNDLDQALELANSLPYGLAAYGFTDSSATAERLITGFEAGILSINHCGGSVPEAPSGGVKDSGYGKEGGPEGLHGYLITKRVHTSWPHDLVPLRRRRLRATGSSRVTSVTAVTGEPVHQHSHSTGRRCTGRTCGCCRRRSPARSSARG